MAVCVCMRVCARAHFHRVRQLFQILHLKKEEEGTKLTELRIYRPQRWNVSTVQNKNIFLFTTLGNSTVFTGQAVVFLGGRGHGWGTRYGGKGMEGR